VFRKEIYLEIHRETGAPAPAKDSAAPGQATGVDASLHELGDGT
jgi:hypothetical protein